MFGFSESLEKTHKKIHEQCYYLIMAQCFYEILDTELDRFQTSKNQRIQKLGIDPAMGRDYATLGIKIMSLSTNAIESLADIYVAELKETVTEQFREVYKSNDKYGQSDITGTFAPMFNKWIRQISQMSEEQLGRLAQQSYAAIKHKEAAKIVYKAFEPDTKYKENISDEATRLIHQCFTSWASNGWFQGEKSEEIQESEAKVENEKQSSEDLNYFEDLATNSKISEEAKKSIYNIHQTLAHFTSLYVSDDAGSMKQSLETPIQTLVALDELICSMSGFEIANNKSKTEYMCNYLSQIVNGSNDLLTYHINKSHAWYIENIQNFSVEVVMSFEAKANGDNGKILDMVVDYFQTPELALAKTSNKILKSSNDSNLQTFKSAILDFLKMNGYQTEHQKQTIFETKPVQSSGSESQSPSGLSNDGAGFL